MMLSINSLKTRPDWTRPLMSRRSWGSNQVVWEPWHVVVDGGSGAQQVVDSLQLSVRQDETMDLLVAAGTRHHDPPHQHRVALLLLFGLQTDRERQPGES